MLIFNGSMCHIKPYNARIHRGTAEGVAQKYYYFISSKSSSVESSSTNNLQYTLQIIILEALSTDYHS